MKQTATFKAFLNQRIVTKTQKIIAHFMAEFDLSCYVEALKVVIIRRFVFNFRDTKTRIKILTRKSKKNFFYRAVSRNKPNENLHEKSQIFFHSLLT